MGFCTPVGLHVLHFHIPYTQRHMHSINLSFHTYTNNDSGVRGGQGRKEKPRSHLALKKIPSTIISHPFSPNLTLNPQPLHYSLQSSSLPPGSPCPQRPECRLRPHRHLPEVCSPPHASCKHRGSLPPAPAWAPHRPCPRLPQRGGRLGARVTPRPTRRAASPPGLVPLPSTAVLGVLTSAVQG